MNTGVAPVKIVETLTTNGLTGHKDTSMVTTKDAPKPSNVVQIPTWAIATFALPILGFIIWFTNFYTVTTFEMNSVKEQIIRNDKDIRLQDAWMRDTRELIIKSGISAEKIPPVPDISRKDK